jgi:hypothetical protein
MGGVVLPITSSSLIRGEKEGRKVGSLLSAVCTMAEGGVDAEGAACGLVGGVGGGSPVSELSLANG